MFHYGDLLTRPLVKSGFCRLGQLQAKPRRLTENMYLPTHGRWGGLLGCLPPPPPPRAQKKPNSSAPPRKKKKKLNKKNQKFDPKQAYDQGRAVGGGFARVFTPPRPKS